MLNKITIKGYKSIRDLSEFELKNLNILIGAKGSYKRKYMKVIFPMQKNTLDLKRLQAML
ncbi:TPA: hypothetical protein RTG46_001737 [Campylobacter jejuni]|nr:hypothetical protein [Campylobacter jejuni]HDZ4977678.1 hypothetical protein [Campylobacter jejuni]HDZ4994646.1 hypothetical protein [Campylobacter jejuni]HDZ4999728.1 hypothetical protein [Campylobacter jejuni]HDZ5004634.1 hypothetical protein [Campylobacter jejuni]